VIASGIEEEEEDEADVGNKLKHIGCEIFINAVTPQDFM